MRKSLKFRKKLLILSLFLSLLAGNFSSLSQEKKELSFPVTQFKLKNGLQVILTEDYSLPLVSIVVGYNVGSIHEPPGKTGLAYLLQNLMFHGSENVGRMQHISLIDKVGGILNATTTEDKTIFQQTVPSNQLVRVLWLESDRMNSLNIDTLDVEQVKEVLINEIQRRKEANPYFDSSLVFDQLLYPDPAYSHPVIGNEADLRDLTVEDIKNFYQTFYRPNNAVISIAGNIDKRKAEREIRKYFESIPRGKDIPSVTPPKPLEKKTVIKTFEDSLAPSPGFHLGYQLASPLSDEFYPLKIIEYILLRGKTSQLYGRLIMKERTAYSLSGGIEKRKELARLKILVTCTSSMMETNEKAIFSELNRIRSNLLPEKELKKAKNLFKMDYLHQFETSLDKALSLAETYLAKERIDDPSDELDKYLAVTPYVIIRAASRYLSQGIILNIRLK